MGLLSKPEVVECSAKDLIGEYVGQTAPKTTKQLELGLGKVLFIDEAYRLGEGPFAIEAANELVDIMTKPKFQGKLIVILAGYDEDMDRLMTVNRGLASRFSEEIFFPPLNPQQSLNLLTAGLQKKEIYLEGADDKNSKSHKDIINLLEKLTSLQSWGNARDIQTLTKTMMGKVFANLTEKSHHLVLPAIVATEVLQEMLNRRLKSEINTSQLPQKAESLLRTQTFDPIRSQAPTAATTTIQTTTPTVQEPLEEDLDSDENFDTVPRDANVSDETWAQLQLAKQAAATEAQRSAQEILEFEQAVKAVEAQRESLRRAEEANRVEADAARRRLEEERIVEARRRLAEERAQAALEAAMKREREKMQREVEARRRLRKMGVCVQGYRWVKVGGGWQCGAGGHFVSDGEIERFGG